MTEIKEKKKIRVENISCVIAETAKLGGLFLGNIYGAQNPEILKEYGIRSVLTSSLETRNSRSLFSQLQPRSYPLPPCHKG